MRDRGAEQKSNGPEETADFVAFVVHGESITDTPLKDRTMAAVLTEKRQWWDEYVDECEALGAEAQTWKEVLTIWRDEAEREAEVARAWAATLSLSLKMLGDADA